MTRYSSYTDKDLCELLKHGDEAAFTTLYDRYWAGIYRNAMKILGDGNDAEDVVQELFESIWKRRETLQINGTLAAYLHTSARYIALHLIEKNVTKAEYGDAVATALLLVENPVIESHMDARALESAIDQIVATLPDKMKTVFLLSRREHLTHKEIAEKLRISEETVKKQVYNALKAIRQQLGPVPLGIMIAVIYTV